MSQEYNVSKQNYNNRNPLSLNKEKKQALPMCLIDLLREGELKNYAIDRERSKIEKERRMRKDSSFNSCFFVC